MWLMKACKYLETRSDYQTLMPVNFTKNFDEPVQPPTPAEVHLCCWMADREELRELH